MSKFVLELTDDELKTFREVMFVSRTALLHERNKIIMAFNKEEHTNNKNNIDKFNGLINFVEYLLNITKL